MDLSVGEAIKILQSFINHEFTALRIEGLEGKTYMISGIGIKDNQIVLRSESLNKDLKGEISLI